MSKVMKVKMEIWGTALVAILKSLVEDKVCSDWASFSEQDAVLAVRHEQNSKVIDAVMQGGFVRVRNADSGLVIGSLNLKNIRKGLQRMMETTNGAETVVRLREGDGTINDLEWFLREAIK